MAALAHEGELAGELLRPPEVVGVDKGDVAAGGGADAGVARRRRAAVLGERDRPDPRIGGGERPDERRRAVARGVVDEDELPVPEALRPDRGHGLGERRGGVPDRGDDRDRRRRRHQLARK